MSVGSLTTTFTPPASCLESFSITTGVTPWLYLVAGPLTTQGCLPYNFQYSSTNYYSPGICPVGYSTACQSSNVEGTVTETVVTCCPTYYACNTDVLYFQQSTYGCSSIFTSTVVFPSLVIVSGTVPVATVSTSATLGAVNAFSVQIRFQSTDFTSSPPITSTMSPSTTTSTMSPSTTTSIVSSSTTTSIVISSTTTSIVSSSTTTSIVISSTTTSIVSSSTTALTSPNSGASGGGGISPGAAAGIGIGSAAGAFLLACAFVCVYKLGYIRRSTETNNALVRRNEVFPVTIPETPGPAYE